MKIPGMVSATVSLRGLLLFAIVIILPALARADDMSFDGGSGCSDPPIFSGIFSLPATNPAGSAAGGLCRAFENHSGGTFHSLSFTAPFANNPSDPFLCSPGQFFTNCDFIVDGFKFSSGTPGSRITSGITITVEFFGTNSDHPGIPSVDPSTNPCATLTLPLAPGCFFLNLNNPGCDATGVCDLPQPTNGTSPGDWGADVTFSAAAATPEPGTWALLLGGIGVLLARAKSGKKQPSRSR